MPDTYISARDWILSVGTDGTTFLPVACLTSVELNSSNEPIDVSSKCGNKLIAGVKFEQNISAEGFAITETGTPTKASENALYDYFTAQTEVYFKIAKATEVAGDLSYTGRAFVGEFNLSSPDGEANTFTATLNVSNPPATQTTKA